MKAQYGSGNSSSTSLLGLYDLLHCHVRFKSHQINVEGYSIFRLALVQQAGVWINFLCMCAQTSQAVSLTH